MSSWCVQSSMKSTAAGWREYSQSCLVMVAPSGWRVSQVWIPKPSGKAGLTCNKGWRGARRERGFVVRGVDDLR